MSSLRIIDDIDLLAGSESELQPIACCSLVKSAASYGGEISHAQSININKIYHRR